MTGIVAGLGAKFAFRAFFGGAVSKAGGLLGGLWHWLSSLNIYQLGCIGLSAFALIQHFSLAGERRHSAKIEAHGKAVAGKLVATIRDLNASLENVTGALNRQNAAVNALAIKTAEQQKLAAEAERKAAVSAREAQGAAATLRASARHSPPPGGPCVPSKTLQDQWQ